jgi:putative membrane protein
VKIAWIVFAALAIVFHLGAFSMESLLFTNDAVQARFNPTGDPLGEPLRLFAFNQGFYNLFLALGCLAGLVLHRTHRAVGHTLAAFTCLCMFGAGVVLVISAPHLARAGLAQALPPLGSLIAGHLLRQREAAAAE